MMPRQDQQEAIQQACGWVYAEMCPWAPWIGPNNKNYVSVPSFTTDLNAMRWAEESLSADEAREYDRQLQKIGYRERLAGAFWLWHMPAEWKVEAFLRTKGLWKEASITS